MVGDDIARGSTSGPRCAPLYESRSVRITCGSRCGANPPLSTVVWWCWSVCDDHHRQRLVVIVVVAHCNEHADGGDCAKGARFEWFHFRCVGYAQLLTAKWNEPASLTFSPAIGCLVSVTPLCAHPRNSRGLRVRYRNAWKLGKAAATPEIVAARSIRGVQFGMRIPARQWCTP